MRKIEDHVVQGEQTKLEIVAVDAPGAGGANHEYLVRFPGYSQVIRFQNGPVKEAGLNGITGEALLAIVIDRLRCFQSGAFACSENQTALEAAETALNSLKSRTEKRIAKSVEGTNVNHEEAVVADVPLPTFVDVGVETVTNPYDAPEASNERQVTYIETGDDTPDLTEVALEFAKVEAEVAPEVTDTPEE